MSIAETENQEGPVEFQARVSLFGYAPAEATVRVYHRDPFWRGSRALLFGGAGLLLAPIAALVPPHAPWGIGAVVIGGIMARRKWAERRTLVSLKSDCPRCESALRCTRPTRIRQPHAITCESCHYEMELEIL